MSFYDLYGINEENIDLAKVRIEEILGFIFSERNSSYNCGKYFLFGDDASEHFVLKENRDPFEDGPAEDAFPNWKLLLYVNETIRSDEIRQALAEEGDGFALLRHENI